jgi:hypothetical protein
MEIEIVIVPASHVDRADCKFRDGMYSSIHFGASDSSQASSRVLNNSSPYPRAKTAPALVLACSQMASSELSLEIKPEPDLESEVALHSGTGTSSASRIRTTTSYRACF